jgi:hypothetical protein
LSLIGEAFVDHSRLVSEPAASAITFAVSDMQAALERLAATASGEGAAAGLQWNGSDGALRPCLAHEDGAASDVIAAETTGVGSRSRS